MPNKRYSELPPEQVADRQTKQRGYYVARRIREGKTPAYGPKVYRATITEQARMIDRAQTKSTRIYMSRDAEVMSASLLADQLWYYLRTNHPSRFYRLGDLSGPARRELLNRLATQTIDFLLAEFFAAVPNPETKYTDEAY